jgi:hypothetical protein
MRTSMVPVRLTVTLDVSGAPELGFAACLAGEPAAA